MKPIALDRSHGGDVPPGVLDFSASINPLGPPPAAIAAYHAAVESIAAYPSPYCPRLAARIAQWLGVDLANIIVGNGSTQLLYLLARVLHPHRPFIVTPTFSEIANALLVAGITPYAIQLSKEHGFELRREALTGALESGADAIFIGRPNSPTGSMIPVGEAIALAEECARRRCWCVFDEAFIDFAGESESVARLIRRAPHVMVLRSLTKIFAIPGLRLGFLVAPPAMVAKLRDNMEPWSVNAVAERVASAMLDETEDFAEQTRRFLAVERDRLAEALSAMPGLRVFPSAANFLMLEVTRPPLGADFAASMLERGIAVRDLRRLPGCEEGAYRIAIRTRRENDRLLRAIGDCLGSQT